MDNTLSVYGSAGAAIIMLGVLLKMILPGVIRMFSKKPEGSEAPKENDSVKSMVMDLRTLIVGYPPGTGGLSAEIRSLRHARGEILDDVREVKDKLVRFDESIEKLVTKQDLELALLKFEKQFVTKDECDIRERKQILNHKLGGEPHGSR